MSWVRRHPFTGTKTLNKKHLLLTSSPTSDCNDPTAATMRLKKRANWSARPRCRSRDCVFSTDLTGQKEGFQQVSLGDLTSYSQSFSVSSKI